MDATGGLFTVDESFIPRQAVNEFGELATGGGGFTEFTLTPGEDAGTSSFRIANARHNSDFTFDQAEAEAGYDSYVSFSVTVE